MKRQRQYILGFLAVLGAIFLFIGGPDADSLRSFRYVWGMGHLFCFALWSYLYVNWRESLSFKRALIEVLILAIVLGGLSELIQSQIGREAAWPDFGNDLVGAIGGLVLFSQSRKMISPWQLKLLQVPVLLLAVWSLWPVGKVIVDDVVSWRQFPLLSGFETPLEKTRWGGSARRKVSHDVYFTGSSSLQIKLTRQRYSGLGLRDFPHDWSDYRSVSLQIFNPDMDSFTLHFRIHDQHHREHKNTYSDRFNSSFDIIPGWNHLQISLAQVVEAPKTRRMDMNKIAGMGLFVGKLDHPRTIYLDDVKLLP
ncbi:MAG: hypothetical protein V2I50_09095 [Desulfuromusa sp.]|nr:hypothetical protein [Desulfuromusa sp.]